MLIFCFKIFGVATFQKLSFLGTMMSLTRKGINLHFTRLTTDLEASGGPYLCGEQYTLADISMVPIFERMEVARWWTDSVKVMTTLGSIFRTACICSLYNVSNAS